MSKRKARDPLAIDIARDREKRGRPANFERIEASLAKLEAATQKSDAARDALVDKLIAAIERLGQLADPRDQKRRIRSEHAKLTDQLRRSGHPQPATQAWEDLAKQYRTSVSALSRSVRARNR